MAPDVLEDLNELKNDLLDDMRAYMEDVQADGDDPGYDDADIAECDAILAGFIARASQLEEGDRAGVMSAVKETVLALNALSERCESLIETDQREDICELIDRAGAALGVGSGEGEDLAGEWREW
jgi:hypothetical protein